MVLKLGEVVYARGNGFNKYTKLKAEFTVITRDRTEKVVNNFNKLNVTIQYRKEQ